MQFLHFALALHNNDLHTLHNENETETYLSMANASNFNKLQAKTRIEKSW